MKVCKLLRITTLKIERKRDGSYKVFEPDEEWVKIQCDLIKSAIQINKEQKYEFYLIFADEILNYLFSQNIEKFNKVKDIYRKSVNNIFKKEGLNVRILFFTDLIRKMEKEFLTIFDFVFNNSDKLFSEEIWKKETELRKKLYNPKGYTIKKKELNLLVKKIFALFAAEVFILNLEWGFENLIFINRSKSNLDKYALFAKLFNLNYKYLIIKNKL